MQSATYPISSSTFAFRSLDDTENKRNSIENARIQQWALNDKTSADPWTTTCIPTTFNMSARPVGTYNLALEGAIDGRRQRSYDFVPTELQANLPKSPTLETIHDTPAQFCADTFLKPINTHLDFGTKGAVVSNIQVSRNDTLGLPAAPSAYVFGNRPQVGVNVRRTTRDFVGYNEGRLKLNQDAKRRRESGLAW